MFIVGVLTLWFAVLTFGIVKRQGQATIQMTRLRKWEGGGARFVEDFCVENASSGVALDVLVMVTSHAGDVVWRSQYAALSPGQKIGVARFTSHQGEGGYWDGMVNVDYYEYDGSERICVEYRDNVLESGLGFVTGKKSRRTDVILEKVTLDAAELPER